MVTSRGPPSSVPGSADPDLRRPKHMGSAGSLRLTLQSPAPIPTASPGPPHSRVRAPWSPAIPDLTPAPWKRSQACARAPARCAPASPAPDVPPRPRPAPADAMTPRRREGRSGPAGRRGRAAAVAGGAANGHGHPGRGAQAAPQPGAADGGGRRAEPDRARGEAGGPLCGAAGAPRSCQARGAGPCVLGGVGGRGPRRDLGGPARTLWPWGQVKDTDPSPGSRLPSAAAPLAVRGAGAPPLARSGPAWWPGR